MKTQTKSVFSDIIQVLQVELAKLELIFYYLAYNIINTQEKVVCGIILRWA